MLVLDEVRCLKLSKKLVIRASQLDFENQLLL